MQHLIELGFGPHFSEQVTDPSDRVVARVSAQQRDRYGLVGCRAPFGEIRGALRHRAESALDLPAVGDWVVVEDGEDLAMIERVLARKTAVVRRAAGERTQPQVVAANVDSVFIVTSANQDFNLRRIERYLATVWDSGARPVIVLNKVDLAHDVEQLICELDEVAFGQPVVATSAATGAGIDAIRAHIETGQTVALVGSSGVGKSTLANLLLGEDRLAVSEIRGDDDKGRHTTTARELFSIPGGGLLIDTPGMRELGLWQDSDGIETAFSDVEAYAADCRFRDCTHTSEPGCGIDAAIERGDLDPQRVAAWDKLLREEAYLTRKRDAAALADSKKRWRAITVGMRHRTKVDPKRAFEKKD